jgi:hypothetical protein
MTSPGSMLDRGHMPPLRVLAAGVDNVYASVRDGLDEQRLAEAICHRAAAYDADETAVCTIPTTGRRLLAKPHGYRKHVTWYTSPDMDVMIGADRNRPAVLLQLRSAFIHRVGVEAAVADGERVASYFCPQVMTPETRRSPVAVRGGIRSDHLPGGSLAVSRIDLYADTQGWDVSLDDLPRFVTRARRRRAWPGEPQVHTDGYQLSGYTFGSGHLLCRIYDKTRLLRKVGETWLREIWEDLDPDRPVWRVEFQFRRGVIRELSIDGEHPHSVADALAVRQALWEYGTEWLSLRDPSADTNRSRWPVAPLWEQLRGVTIGSPFSDLVRKRVAEADRLRLLQGFTGYATSLAARGYGRGPDETLGNIAPDMKRYLDARERSFVQIAEHKRERHLAG